MITANRKILITNDDGIDADGLVRLVKEAIHFGEVWVVSPDGERSAASHSISLHTPLDVYPYDFGVEGVHAFTCSGTPADCVRVGSIALMPCRPDIVLSGINYGYNTATDLQYSATAGAAFEAAFQGYPAIALSEGRKGHEVADRYLHAILEELLGEISQVMPKDRTAEVNRDDRKGKADMESSSVGWIWNVNFPECPLEQFRGILRDRKVSQSMLFKDGYDLKEKLPNGGMRYMVNGVYQEIAEEGTDLRAVLDGYISIGMVANIGQ